MMGLVRGSCASIHHSLMAGLCSCFCTRRQNRCYLLDMENELQMGWKAGGIYALCQHDRLIVLPPISGIMIGQTVASWKSVTANGSPRMEMWCVVIESGRSQHCLFQDRVYLQGQPQPDVYWDRSRKKSQNGEESLTGQASDNIRRVMLCWSSLASGSTVATLADSALTTSKRHISTDDDLSSGSVADSTQHYRAAVRHCLASSSRPGISASERVLSAWMSVVQRAVPAQKSAGETVISAV